MHTFCCRDLPESLLMPFQQFQRSLTVICICDGLQQCPHLAETLFHLNGRRRYQRRQIHRVPVIRQTDALHCHLQGIPEFRYISPNLYDLSFVFSVDGPAVVPYLGIHSTGLV